MKGFLRGRRANNSLASSNLKVRSCYTLLCSTTAAAVVVAAGTVAIVAQSSHQCDRL